jgi:hypothetical protein
MQAGGIRASRARPPSRERYGSAVAETWMMVRFRSSSASPASATSDLRSTARHHTQGGRAAVDKFRPAYQEGSSEHGRDLPERRRWRARGLSIGRLPRGQA